MPCTAIVVAPLGAGLAQQPRGDVVPAGTVQHHHHILRGQRVAHGVQCHRAAVHGTRRPPRCAVDASAARAARPSHPTRRTGAPARRRRSTGRLLHARHIDPADGIAQRPGGGAGEDLEHLGGGVLRRDLPADVPLPAGLGVAAVLQRDRAAQLREARSTRGAWRDGRRSRRSPRPRWASAVMLVEPAARGSARISSATRRMVGVSSASASRRVCSAGREAAGGLRGHDRSRVGRLRCRTAGRRRWCPRPAPL